ncbi:hypothetical protein CPB83DRAFT_808913 [Crepidotus variabilis]|uniref:choline-phosphate cytidylyltransferase n=1 Tax=Crepidotus variabilis TaxID=179855 RepID=A0A9P6EMD5_9AGAR|nr:hypothetical protein CPB83DRAFT_808913 [Crepidotus variabilis]
MDNATAFSDDEDYDVISNPGHDGELTPEEILLGRGTTTSRELPAFEDAQDRFETTRWKASEVEAYVKKQLETTQLFDKKRVKVYVDGTFDTFGVGQALQLRQAKLAFPYVHLIVGVFSDDTLHQNNCASTYPEVERAELVRHCRWVDEVIKDAPWAVNIDFLNQRRIDFVAIDEGSSVDPTCDKARLRGYDELKKRGKIIKTRRTLGLTSQHRPSMFNLQSESQRATPTLPHTSPVATRVSELKPDIDVFGIGIGCGT